MRTRENTVMMVIALFSLPSFANFCLLSSPALFLSPSFLPALLSSCVTDLTDKSRAIEPCITVREEKVYLLKRLGPVLLYDS